MKIPESTINFEVYENAVNFMGIASITLPDIANLTQTISGAGIAGEYESVIIGHISAMELSMNFRQVTEDTARLNEQREHLLELRSAMQTTDTATSTKSIVPNKYVVACTPKRLGLGNMAPSSPADASGAYSVRYIAGYVDGKKLLEIDQLNYIFYVNGTDYLTDVRKALGRA